MGHLIEDSQDQRSYYLNDDLLEELNDVMKNHPLRLLFGDKVTYEKSVTILHGKSNKAYIRIAAKEPNDSIELEVEKHKGQEGLYGVSSSNSVKISSDIACIWFSKLFMVPLTILRGWPLISTSPSYSFSQSHSITCGLPAFGLALGLPVFESKRVPNLLSKRFFCSSDPKNRRKTTRSWLFSMGISPE